jgi:vacuolar protein sorting-associated protein 13A/C
MVGSSTGQVHLMSADVKLGGSTIFVVISRAEEWPFVIENDSDHAFAVYQIVRVIGSIVCY